MFPCGHGKMTRADPTYRPGIERAVRTREPSTYIVSTQLVDRRSLYIDCLDSTNVKNAEGSE